MTAALLIAAIPNLKITTTRQTGGLLCGIPSMAEQTPKDNVIPMAVRENSNYVKAAHTLDGATEKEVQHDEDIKKPYPCLAPSMVRNAPTFLALMQEARLQKTATLI